MNVKFFAVARDVAGMEEVTLTMPEGSTPADVLSSLEVTYPRFGEWKGHLRVAVNQEYAPGKVTLKDRDELAIIPPVSGG
ncbi:MAG TPA: molybdopterin converting factor subunit 1 [Bacteroidota bacterium]